MPAARLATSSAPMPGCMLCSRLASTLAVAVKHDVYRGVGSRLDVVAGHHFAQPCLHHRAADDRPAPRLHVGGTRRQAGETQDLPHVLLGQTVRYERAYAPPALADRADHFAAYNFLIQI